MNEKYALNVVGNAKSKKRENWLIYVSKIRGRKHE